MARGWRLIAVALGFLALAGLAPPPRIVYVLEPILEDGALRAVQIDVRFRGDADGETQIQLPNAWGGQEELWRGIERLEVISRGALADGDGPGARIVRHRPGARVHLRYRVVQDWEGEPSTRQGNTYRPIIQPTYFHLIGTASLILPDIDASTMVRLETRNFPRGWSFASDLEHAPLHYARIPMSVTVGGDYRVLEGPPGSGVRVALRGAWSFTDEDFTNEVSRIISGQRRFWGDESAPYLVTVTHLSSDNPNWLSVGGTGLDDAFALFSTANLTAHALTRTLAHEAMHTWIPGRIGGLRREDEALQYWLSEGFTDFYAARILVREGVWSPADFAADLNDMLGAYARSPVRAEPNARIGADFWSNGDVQDLPYQRGRLFATIWDARLRAMGGGLDDLVLDMQTRSRAAPEANAVELFVQAAIAAGLDPGAEISAFVDAGAPIFLPEEAFAPCGHVTTRQAPEFHRGFDIEATQANNNVIAGVIPEGPAYAAGMRNGMVLVRRSGGEIGNSEIEIAYVVRDGGSERTLTYLPQGPRVLTRQMLVLDPTLQGDRLAQCVRVLGGA